jgi:hypothetical protein
MTFEFEKRLANKNHIGWIHVESPTVADSKDIIPLCVLTLRRGQC